MRARGVMVLGMHRSGTSAAARVLTSLGLTASRPDDAVRGPWNPKGHYESQAMMHLDNRLLSEMGCTWWYPPAPGAAYAEAEARRTTTARHARRVFRRAYPRRRWVWKDPRACLLLPFWRSVVGEGTAAVVVLRNPLDVAASLERRNTTSIAFGVALWARYYRLLLEHTVGMPALVTRFDDLVVDPAGWAAAAGAFLSEIGLPPPSSPAEALDQSVDGSLRHSHHDRDDLCRESPDAVALFDAWNALVGAWPALEAPSVGAEPPSVQAELDAVGPGHDPGWRPPPERASEAGAAAEPRPEERTPWT